MWEYVTASVAVAGYICYKFKYELFRAYAHTVESVKTWGPSAMIIYETKIHDNFVEHKYAYRPEQNGPTHYYKSKESPIKIPKESPFNSATFHNDHVTVDLTEFFKEISGPSGTDYKNWTYQDIIKSRGLEDLAPGEITFMDSNLDIHSFKEGPIRFKED